MSVEYLSIFINFSFYFYVAIRSTLQLPITNKFVSIQCLCLGCLFHTQHLKAQVRRRSTLLIQNGGGEGGNGPGAQFLLLSFETSVQPSMHLINKPHHNCGTEGYGVPKLHRCYEDGGRGAHG